MAASFSQGLPKAESSQQKFIDASPIQNAESEWDLCRAIQAIAGQIVERQSGLFVIEYAQMSKAFLVNPITDPEQRQGPLPGVIQAAFNGLIRVNDAFHEERKAEINLTERIQAGMSVLHWTREQKATHMKDSTESKE